MVNTKLNSQDIIKGICAGLCLLDRDFHILWVNKVQSEWFGAKKDIYGKHCYGAFEHRTHVCRGCPTLKVFNTGMVHKANRIGITKDGHKRYYQLTVSPIKDGHNRVDFALELVQDITDKVIGERKTQNITSRLNRMTERLVFANRKLRRNTQKLKDVAFRMNKCNSALNKKYHRKIDELTSIKEELRNIFKVNHLLSSDVDFKKTISLITRLTCELMHTDSCILRLIDEDKRALTANSSYCVSPSFMEKAGTLKIGEGVSGKAVKLRRPVVISDTEKDVNVKYHGPLKEEGIVSALAVPIVFQQKVLGAISAYSKSKRTFTKEETRVLSIFASHVAIAIHESKYYEDIHRNYFNTIHALVLAVEARDPYTRGHTERVTRFSMDIAKKMRLPQAEMETLRYAAEVHDIGKIGIPDNILSKPSRLNATERAVIELHPAKGAEMLEPLEFLKRGIPIVRHHHERYDGSGYPDGLEKEKIPILARILACADAFDAMTSDRPYRIRRLNIEEALAEIKDNAGTQFDPKIAGAFIHIIRSQDHKSLVRTFKEHDSIFRQPKNPRE